MSQPSNMGNLHLLVLIFQILLNSFCGFGPWKCHADIPLVNTFEVLKKQKVFAFGTAMLFLLLF